MKNDQMPEGFLATRDGDTVRVHLPEIVVTTSSVLEPMLTRGAAQQVAEAIWNADVESPLARVVLVRDPRYTEANVEKFRERLWAVLVEGGVETPIDIELAEVAATEAPPSVAESKQEAPHEPSKEPAAPPPGAKPSPTTAAEGARKPFVAPIPTRRRVGGDRGRTEQDKT